MENVPATTRSRMPAVVDAAVANLPQALQDKLRAEAEAMKAKIGAGGGRKIKLTKDKKFQLPDGQKSAGPLRVVVLDAIAYNAFYDRPFDTSGKDKTPPACFALAPVQPKDLVPSAASPDVQARSCRECPNNVFGSKGTGKACSNHYRLAVVGIDKPDSEMYEIQVPAGSVKYWEAAVGQIRTRYGFGPVIVSTEVWFNPDKEHQELRFGNFEGNQFLEAHMERIEEAKAMISAEPDVSTYKKPEAAKPRR